ncbi:MAG: Nif11-like leader peptide family RiPP precursor [Synergistaceae bacterium]|nr:Nif11-like leader peptide family RiPP precursor [Synergistaceae bacterium]
MKTLQEFYEEVKTSDDLKKLLAEAAKSGKITEFLKAHDCDATADELKEFVAGKVAQDKPIELSDEELEKVAGGDGEDLNSLHCTDRCSIQVCQPSDLCCC